MECKDFPCEHCTWLLEKHPDKLKDYERYKKLGLEEWIRFHAERAKKGFASATRKYYAKAKAK